MKDKNIKEIKKCQLCGNPEKKIVFDFGKYKVVKCVQCKYVYLSPRPVNTSVLYSNDYFDEKYYFEKENFFEINKKIDSVSANLKYIKKYKNTGEFLEIGSNYGFFLYSVKENGFNATGIEVNSRCAGFSEKVLGLNVINKNVEDVDFTAEKFDIIYMSHVLEHFDDVVGILRKITSWLKKDGIIVIKVPDIDCIEAKRDKENFRGLSIPYHLSHFSLTSLKSLAEKCMLNIVYFDTWIDSSVSERFLLFKNLTKLKKQSNRYSDKEIKMTKYIFKENIFNRIKHFIKTQLFFWARGRSLTVVMKKK